MTRRAYGAARFNAPGTFAGLAFSPDSRVLGALLPGARSTRWATFAVDSGALLEQRELAGVWRTVHVLPSGDLIVGAWGEVRRLSAAGETIWTVRGGQELSLRAVSPDGSLVAIVRGAQVEVRDATRGDVVRSVQEKEGDIFAVAFRADGGALATGSAKGTVRLHDPRSGAALARRKTTKVLALAFSRAGEHLLVGHGNGEVALWQADDLRPVRPRFGRHTFDQGGDAGCRWVGFSPEGARAFSLGNEHCLRAWSVPGGAAGPAIAIPARHAQGPSAALSPDGRWLAVGSTEGALSVWSAEDGAPRVENAAPMPVLGLALTPHAVIAASASRWVAWDRATGKAAELATNFPPIDVAALASGTLVRLDHDKIFVGDTLDPEAPPDLELSTYASGPLALSRGGALLAAPAQEHVELWDLARSVRLAALPHAGPTRACAFGPDDAWLATAGGRRARPARRRSARADRDGRALRAAPRRGALPVRGPLQAHERGLPRADREGPRR